VGEEKGGETMPSNRHPAVAAGYDKNARKQTPASRKGAQTKPKPKPAHPVRVRTKQLDQVDETKIALAYWLLAKAIVENKSERDISDEEAADVAREFERLDPGSRRGEES
jgi:hypothetical protein